MGGEYTPFNAFGRFDFTAPTSPEEEEEERRRREGMFTPAPGGGEASALLAPEAPPEEGVEDFGVIQAPEIQGMPPSPTAGIAEQYQDWMSRQPERPDPSLGRKILGGAVGFLAGMGGGVQAGRSVNRRIQYGGYDEDVAEWEQEGEALKDVGTYTTTAAETERKGRGDVMRLEGINRRVTAARESIEQRKTAEESRHADREAADLTDNERLEETKEHNNALEAIAEENNRIDAIFGAAATSRAESAATEAERGPRPTKLGGYTDLSNAMMDSLKEMMAIYPGMSKYFKAIGDRDVAIIKGLDLSNEEHGEFTFWLDTAKKKAVEKLKTLQGDDVEPFMRGEVQ
ncbi:hypothetical protein LCGC14_0478200 [marine sediment metagenome]|uniref:Uncharacterized protein n=1 Tax=marine sediment metagenome TaxID=412755 RepID=A0A0F9SA73_9ZZZZ